MLKTSDQVVAMVRVQGTSHHFMLSAIEPRFRSSSECAGGPAGFGNDYKSQRGVNHHANALPTLGIWRLTSHSLADFIKKALNMNDA